MNYTLPFLPQRGSKPRDKGLAMVMDMGQSFEEAKSLVSVAGHLVDYVKLAFGTSIATNGLRDKISFYHDAGIKVYFGGTLFEAFVLRDMYDDFEDLLKKYDMRTVEISDGCIRLDHKRKCEIINRLVSKDYEVISEVGTKAENSEMLQSDWIENMTTELEAGASLVTAEARENGTVGIYNRDGSANSSLIDLIQREVPENKILWETPNKSQQVWFIKQFGAHVNLGNIDPKEIIALETLRLGLREDTLFEFLPDALHALKQ